MNIAIYSRVSTDQQTTENQLSQLRAFAAKQGWNVVHEFTDTASGAKSEAQRPGFKAMMAAASRREFDLLLFWALDRFTREGTFKTLEYLNRLESYGVGYRSFQEAHFDSCGPFKDVVLAVAATLAKQERARLSERTKAGLATARRYGKVIGRPRVAVSHSEVKALRQTGLSIRQIASRLSVSVGTVHSLLAA
jgi:DNA invertase Pin-like site-specific DNA recombinase